MWILGERDSLSNLFGGVFKVFVKLFGVSVMCELRCEARAEAVEGERVARVVENWDYDVINRRGRGEK